MAWRIEVVKEFLRDNGIQRKRRDKILKRFKRVQHRKKQAPINSAEYFLGSRSLAAKLWKAWWAGSYLHHIPTTPQ